MPPPQPGSCRLICILYGESKTKENVRVVMDAPCLWPRDTTAEQKRYATNIIHVTQLEIKHSAPWKCFNCGQTAQSVTHSPMCWTHLPIPFMYDIAHAVCRNGGPCRKRIDDENAEWARSVGQAPPQDITPGSDAPSLDPPAAACANCSKVKTVHKCGRCKLIKYCGRECQAADYARHKAICKGVRKVEFNTGDKVYDNDPFAD